MAKPCGVCTHPSRLAIEQAIVSGKTLTSVARNFGFTYTSRTGAHKGEEVPDHKVIQVHRDKHMANAYQAAMANREEQSGALMADRLRILDAEVDRVIARANEGRILEVGGVPLLDDDGKTIRVHDNRLLLAAVREGRQNLDLMARLAGKVENEPEDLEQIRAYLASPEARRLLAKLDRVEADQAEQERAK